MSLVGTWVPGSSVLHRVPAGPKLVGLAAVEVAVALAVRTPAAVAVAAVATVAAYALAHVPVRTAVRMLRPIGVIAVLVGAAQWVYAGPERAVVVAGQLVVAVALAVLVTVTTRTSALLDAVERGLRPLRRVGWTRAGSPSRSPWPCGRSRWSPTCSASCGRRTGPGAPPG